MKIVVCIKQVPDTEAVIRVKANGTETEGEGINYITSPYDEVALEEAIRIKEKLGGDLVVMTIGAARAKDELRKALAIGYGKAVHLVDPAFDNADAYATAKVLAAAIKAEGFDLVLLGRQAIDDDHAQMG